MRIQIDAIDSSDSVTRVHFKCGRGDAVAQWASATAPSKGSEYIVEIDIEAEIDFSKNALLCPELRYGVSSDDSFVTFYGKIEGQDDDRMAYLRLSEDCLIMCESVDSELADKPIRLTVPIAQVRVTPIGA